MADEMAIELVYPTLRVALGDWDPSVQQYSNGTLLNAVRAAVQLRRLPAVTLSADQNSVTPDLAAASADPNQFALLVLHSCRLFQLPANGRYSFRQRSGVSESFGGNKDLLQTLEYEIHNLENGTAFLGWQSYHAWMSGMAGLPVGLELTHINVAAPFFTVSLSTGGASVS